MVKQLLNEESVKNARQCVQGVRDANAVAVDALFAEDVGKVRGGIFMTQNRLGPAEDALNDLGSPKPFIMIGDVGISGGQFVCITGFAMLGFAVWRSKLEPTIPVEPTTENGSPPSTLPIDHETADSAESMSMDVTEPVETDGGSQLDNVAGMVDEKLPNPGDETLSLDDVLSQIGACAAKYGLRTILVPACTGAGATIVLVCTRELLSTDLSSVEENYWLGVHASEYGVGRNAPFSD